MIGGTTEANVTTKLKYETWGRRTDASPTAWTAVGSLGFAGQAMDAGSNLIYMRARYYDPKTAQFTTVDPKLATTGQPYLYANGNPTMFTDPTGESFAENFTNGMLHGATGGALKPGTAEGSCSRAYFLGTQVGSALSPSAKLKKLEELLGAGGAALAAGIGKFGGKMLGEKGAQFVSKTLLNAGGSRKYRIDVENPAPGIRPGQLHLQIGPKGTKEEKYLYDFNTDSFVGMPPALQKQIDRDPEVAKAIARGREYLGLE